MEKNQIYKSLADRGSRHPEVWFEEFEHWQTGEVGWHYREFGQSEIIFLGKDFESALRAASGEIE
jgi:hypothetical protein